MRRAFAVLICTFACHSSEAATPAPQSQPALHYGSGTIRFDTARGPWVVRVEVASDDVARARGLMFRRELKPDTGMLFVFESAEEHNFWMHNTFISLDLIYLGDDRAVVGVVRSAPAMTDDLRGVGKPSRYVVEVGAGEAVAHGVVPGTRVAFIDVAE
jgi:uncharacterized membrane protein (UPF0127 family)